jgi:hypothetical protein
MTIASTAYRADYYSNGVTVAYPFTFRIFAATDLSVLLNNIPTTNFTVTGIDVDAGGTVTLGVAPASGVLVSIISNVPATQSVHYPTNDPFPAATHEKALDKLTRLVTQAIGIATRSVRFAAGSVNAAAGAIMPDLVASTYPRVKADCSGFDLVTLQVTTGTYVNPVTTKGDLIIGDSTGTQARLSYAVDGDYLGATAGLPAWRTPAQVRSDVSVQPDNCDVIASAATLPVTCSKYQTVTGSTGVTALAPQPPGTAITLTFASTPKLTNGSTLLLEGCGSFTAVGCDTMTLVSESYAGTWRELSRSTRPAERPLNLRIQRNAATPATKLDVTADQLIVGGVSVPSFAVTIDASVVGANGIDAGALTTCTLYYVHAIYNSSLHTAAGLISTSESAPTVPGSFTRSQLLGAMRTDASSNFLDGYQQDDEFFYTVPIVICTSNVATLRAQDCDLYAIHKLVPQTTAKGYTLEIVPANTQIIYLHWTNFSPGDGKAIARAGSQDNTGNGMRGHVYLPANCATATKFSWGSNLAGAATIYVTGWKMRFKG